MNNIVGNLDGLRLIHAQSIVDGSPFEIRIKTKRGMYYGFFDSIDKGIESLEDFGMKWEAAWTNLHQLSISPDRITNVIRLAEDAALTGNNDIARRNWVVIDIDPIRFPKDQPSSDSERAIALEVTREISEFLQMRGLPEPIVADSGNGYHLLWKCWLKSNSETNTKLIYEVASRYNSRSVDIDLSVGNAGRIWKIYGTMSRKGESSEERRFRPSKIIRIPNHTPILTEVDFESVLSDVVPEVIQYGDKKFPDGRPRKFESKIREYIELPKREVEGGNFEYVQDRKIDPIAKIQSWGLKISRVVERGKMKCHELKECPCGRKEKGSALYVVDGGGIGFGCKHATCEFSESEGKNKWKELREKFEDRPQKQEDLIENLLGIGGGKRSGVRSEVKSEVRSEVRSEAKSEAERKSEVRSEAKSEAERKLEVESKKKSLAELLGEDDLDGLLDDEPLIGRKTESKQDRAAESKPERKPDRAVESKPDRAVESKPESKPDSKPDNKPGPKNLLEELDRLLSDNGITETDSGERLFGRIRNLEVKRSAADNRRIVKSDEDFHIIYQHVFEEIALQKEVFTSSGRLAYVDMEKGSMSPYETEGIDRLAWRTCEFVKLKKVEGGHIMMPSPAPKRVIDALASELDHNDRAVLREVQQVVRAPFFTNSGTLIGSPGYNKESKTYMIDTPKIVMPDTIDEAMSIINEVVGDFPFESMAEKANYIGGLITPAVRMMIDGPVPMLVIEANRRGTGKTKLAQIIQVIYGLMPEVGEFPNDEDAMAKLMLSIVVEGMPIHLFDNITRTIASATLDKVLTTGYYSARILGKTKNLHCKVVQMFIAALNNARMTEDMSRRFVRCRLHTNMAKPEKRTGFKISGNILTWVRENRGRILGAILKLVKNWIDDGRPIPDNMPRLGSYESWRDVVGAVMFHCGQTEWLANLDKAQEEATLADEWGDFFELWYENLGSKSYLTGIIELAEKNGMLGNILHDKSEGKKQYMMRMALMDRRDSTIGGFKLSIEKDKKTKTLTYSLTPSREG